MRRHATLGVCAMALCMASAARADAPALRCATVRACVDAGRAHPADFTERVGPALDGLPVVAHFSGIDFVDRNLALQTFVRERSSYLGKQRRCDADCRNRLIALARRPGREPRMIEELLTPLVLDAAGRDRLATLFARADDAIAVQAAELLLRNGAYRPPTAPTIVARAHALLWKTSLADPEHGSLGVLRDDPEFVPRLEARIDETLRGGTLRYADLALWQTARWRGGFDHAAFARLLGWAEDARADVAAPARNLVTRIASGPKLTPAELSRVLALLTRMAHEADPVARANVAATLESGGAYARPEATLLLTLLMNDGEMRVRQNVVRAARALPASTPERAAILTGLVGDREPSIASEALGALPRPLSADARRAVLQLVRSVDAARLDADPIWPQVLLDAGVATEVRDDGPFHAVSRDEGRAHPRIDCGTPLLNAAYASQLRRKNAEIFGGALVADIAAEDAAARLKAAAERAALHRRLLDARAELLR